MGRDAVNFRHIDLSLLMALDALVTERSVTKAAERLHISQPAMSHALARLRSVFDDPILVRGKGGMVPTTKAVRILGPTRQAICELEKSLAPFRHFDIENDDSVFRIGIVDYVELVLMPEVMARIRSMAPKLSVQVRPLVSNSEIADDLSTGQLDLAIAFFPEVPESLRRQRLGDEQYVCIARRGLIDPLDFTLQRFLDAQHLVVSPGGVSHKTMVDKILDQRRLRRRVVYSTTRFTTAAAVIERTDLIATVQRQVAMRMQNGFAIDVLPLPLDPLPLVLAQVWHERTHSDPAQAWLRKVFVESYAAVSENSIREYRQSKETIRKIVPCS